jgi:hypothetical protein
MVPLDPPWATLSALDRLDGVKAPERAPSTHQGRNLMARTTFVTVERAAARLARALGATAVQVDAGSASNGVSWVVQLIFPAARTEVIALSSSARGAADRLDAMTEGAELAQRLSESAR